MSPADSINIGDAMDQPSSPISSPPNSRHLSPNKRPRSPTDSDGGRDNNHESDDAIDPLLRNQGPTGPLARSASQNLTVFAKRYATKQKLNPQQVTEVETFVAVSKCFRDNATII
jgi:hypothetical protein